MALRYKLACSLLTSARSLLSPSFLLDEILIVLSIPVPRS